MIPKIEQEELFPEVAATPKNRYQFDDKEHLHLLDGKNLYGTTTVLGVIGKPLTWWAAGCSMKHFGWINQKPSKGPIPSKGEILAAAKVGFDSVMSMDLETYAKHLHKAYRAHKDDLDQSADAGVDLHAIIEVHILYCIKNNGGKPVLVADLDPRVNAFISWSMSHVKQFLWTEMNHYSERIWVGGQSDFGYLDPQDKLILADVKSAREAYFSHFCQAGAYDIQIMENGGMDALGNKTFDLAGRTIDRYEVFAMGQPGWSEPAVEHNTGLYKRAFEAALELFKAKEAFEK